MAPAEVAFAEAAVTDDALSSLLALLGTAADLLSGHDCYSCVERWGEFRGFWAVTG